MIEVRFDNDGYNFCTRCGEHGVDHTYKGYRLYCKEIPPYKLPEIDMSTGNNQRVDTERYIEMVRTLGIEEAYKQRFRCTGRTVRDVLNLAMHMSNGAKVHLVYTDKPGQTSSYCHSVVDRVIRLLDAEGMQYDKTVAGVSFPQSGGTISVVSANNPHATLGLRGWQEYKLHDC